MIQKIYNIQALRGIAVLLVLLYHLIPIEAKYNEGFTVVPSFFKIGNIGVDLFFVISGFIMVVVTRNYHMDKNKFLKFIYSRFTRIYGPYWFYSLLLLPVLFYKPEWVNSSQAGEVNLITSFLLFPSETTPLIMVGWSLIHEIYFYIIFGFFILFARKEQLFNYCLIWLTLILVYHFFFIPRNPFIELIAHPLTIEFIFGVFIGIYYVKDQKSHIKSKFILFIPLSCLLLIPYIFPGTENDWLRLLKYGVVSVFIVFSSIELEKKGFIFNKFFILIGDASYSIYLSHILILSLVGKIFNIYVIESIWFEIAMVFSMIIITITWGLISYKYIETPLTIFFKKMYKII